MDPTDAAAAAFHARVWRDELGEALEDGPSLADLFRAYVEDRPGLLDNVLGRARRLDRIHVPNNGTRSAWYMAIIFAALTETPFVIGADLEVDGFADHMVFDELRAILCQRYIEFDDKRIPLDIPRAFEGAFPHYPGPLQDIIFGRLSCTHQLHAFLTLKVIERQRHVLWSFLLNQTHACSRLLKQTF